MSGKIEDPPPWVDSKNIDDRIDETCKLYGIETLDSAARQRDGGNIAEDATEADSIVSEASSKEPIPLQERINSQLFITRETSSGRVLWKSPIEESDTLADHFVALHNLRYRLSCHSFRSMLPPLDEGVRPPVRSPTWLRQCMRGVLFSAWESYLEDRLAGDHFSPLRFPEHVYSWFGEDHHWKNASEHMKKVEDRWAFYYGIKGLSNSDDEGWIVYRLLDDMEGEHFFSFFVDAITTIRQEMGQSWNYQLGETWLHAEAFRNKSDLEDSLRKNGLSLNGNEIENDRSQTNSTSNMWVPNVWVPIETSKKVIHQLFYANDWIKSSKYTEKLADRANGLGASIQNSALLFEAAEQKDKKKKESTQCIELFTFIHLVCSCYLEHMQKQMTLIRLMIETSSTGELTDFYDQPDEHYKEEASQIIDPGDTDSDGNMAHFPQFCKILKTVWPSVSFKEMTLMYREAYDAQYPPLLWNKPAPNGITFHGFLAAAERRCLFTRLRCGGSLDP